MGEWTVLWREGDERIVACRTDEDGLAVRVEVRVEGLLGEEWDTSPDGESVALPAAGIPALVGLLRPRSEEGLASSRTEELLSRIPSESERDELRSVLYVLRRSRNQERERARRYARLLLEARRAAPHQGEE